MSGDLGGGLFSSKPLAALTKVILAKDMSLARSLVFAPGRMLERVGVGLGKVRPVLPLAFPLFHSGRVVDAR